MRSEESETQTKVMIVIGYAWGGGIDKMRGDNRSKGGTYHVTWPDTGFNVSISFLFN